MLYIINNISYDYKKLTTIKNKKENIPNKLQKELLNCFMDNPKSILTKQTIMEDVWERIDTSFSVGQFISTLRNYFVNDANHPYFFHTGSNKPIDVCTRQNTTCKGMAERHKIQAN